MSDIYGTILAFANFVSPLIGGYLYKVTGNNAGITCDIISTVLIIFGCIFMVFNCGLNVFSEAK